MISVGIDTGLANAITVLGVEPGQRPSFISTWTIEVGHKVPLAKTRILKGRGRGGKAGREQTDETVIDDDDLRAFWRQMRAVLDGIRDERDDETVIVTVERADRVYERARFGGSMGTGLVRAAWLGGEVSSLARFIFGPERVHTVSEANWRKPLIGGMTANGRTENQLIEIAIRAAVTGWPGPKQSNNHERDAGGIAHWGFGMVRMLEMRDKLNSMGRVSKEEQDRIKKLIRFT